MPWQRDRLPTPVLLGFLCGSAGKESACNAGDLGNPCSLPYSISFLVPKPKRAWRPNNVLYGTQALQEITAYPCCSFCPTPGGWHGGWTCRLGGQWENMSVLHKASEGQGCSCPSTLQVPCYQSNLRAGEISDSHQRLATFFQGHAYRKVYWLLRTQDLHRGAADMAEMSRGD